MDYRIPTWPGLGQPGRHAIDKALEDWTEATAFGDTVSNLSPAPFDPAECTCLDRALEELEELLAALDAYRVSH